MENIKKNLLSNLDDMNNLIDHHNEDEQVVYLTSKYFNEETQTGYEMHVEAIAVMTEKFEDGNFHADRGDWEGRGSYWDVCDVKIESVTILTFEDEEVDFSISNKEVLDVIKF